MKFDVNWCMKCSIIENGDELMLMDSHAHSQPQFRYFRSQIDQFVGLCWALLLLLLIDYSHMPVILRR